MRFLVQVDDAWTVTIRSEKSNTVWRRALLKEHDGQGVLWPKPDPATLNPAEQATMGLHQQPAAEIRAIYARIVARTPDPGDMEAYGSYLLHSLIGSVIWTAIKAEACAQETKFIELALSWDKADVNLSRLHWEMMCHEHRFLVLGLSDAGPKIDVAITRLVPGATASAKPLGVTPRVLFVIGQTLTDPTIRPGAEIMSLLQQSKFDHRLNPAYLEHASPERIERKVQAFEPEIVHFICHGMIDATNRGTLILQPDPPDTNKNFGGEQIAQWMRAAPSMPQIIVLSACESGIASGEAVGPQVVSPLAAALVAHGIPIVIGMSGRISDLACRLFTRRFAEALFSGDTLVAAAAQGRRVAFSQGNAPNLPDWAFPTIYLSPEVESHYAPACKDAGPDIEARLRPYALPNAPNARPDAPIFCGRQDFFEGYRDLLEGKSKNVLAASVADETKGHGRTRLLQQLTLRAVIDGNVPCPVLSNGQTWKAPNDALAVAGLFDEATKLARLSLGLPTGEDTPVEQLQMYKNGNLSRNELRSQIAKDLRLTTPVPKPGEAPEVKPSTIRVALALQFGELMTEARDKHPALIKPTSRAILLLDDADEYLELLLNIVDEKTLGVSGFGGAERVPVIMAFSGRKTARDVVAPYSPRVGWNMMELRPFGKAANGREDMLAYARVLMNPFNENILRNVSGKAWFMDYGAPATSISECERNYSDLLTGMPAEFWSRDFYFIAAIAAKNAFVQAATDDQALEALIEP
jgi:hypothetical protein